MKYVGVDLHQKSIAVCVLNQERKVLERRSLYCQEPGSILAFFRGLGEFEAAVEATASHQWLFDLLEPLRQKILLVHPGKMRVIAESTKKSDKLDAQVLAEFLVMGWIPQAHLPGKRQRELRRLVRHRIDVTRRRVQVQTKIRRLLSHSNFTRSRMFNAEGLAWMKSLKLSPSDRFVLLQLLAVRKLLIHQEVMTQRRLAKMAETAPVKEKVARQLLETVPGVGKTVANIFLAELGEVDRFSSSKKVAAYTGLAPARRESAGKGKELGITKQGTRWLRWAMNQAAWVAVRHSPHWRDVYQKLAKRRGSKKAITAVSRRLLTVMVAVVRTGKPYDATKTLLSHHPPKKKQAEFQPITATTELERS